ncbi:MAG: cytochrome c [Burkholderiales bacterium]|nr:cytochrome c [Burkholderiales bacterium]
MHKRWQEVAFTLLWSALGAAAAPAPASVHASAVHRTARDANARSIVAPIGLGVPLSAAQLAPYAITIFPDGRNLPPGQGSVAQGAPLFQLHCAGCHGATGIEGPAARLAGSDGFVGWNDPLRVLRIMKHPLLVQSVGARWPYATTIFDYVRRAMPYHAPKSLQDDEVYAITAHLLHRMGVVQAGAVMNATTLPQVIMPARGHSVSAWPNSP